MTPQGIDPETVRIVAQCLNHYATSGPQILAWKTILKVTQSISEEDTWIEVVLRDTRVCFQDKAQRRRVTITVILCQLW